MLSFHGSGDITRPNCGKIEEAGSNFIYNVEGIYLVPLGDFSPPILRLVSAQSDQNALVPRIEREDAAADCSRSRNRLSHMKSDS